MPLALRRRVFLEALKIAGVPLFRVRLSHLEQLESLIEGRARGPVNLPRQFLARREPGRIVIKKVLDLPQSFRFKLEGPGVYRLPDNRKLIVKVGPASQAPPGAIIIDTKKVGKNLIVRSPLPGDRIRPPGFPGKGNFRMRVVVYGL